MRVAVTVRSYRRFGKGFRSAAGKAGRTGMDLPLQLPSLLESPQANFAFGLRGLSHEALYLSLFSEYGRNASTRSLETYPVPWSWEGELSIALCSFGPL